MMHSWQALLLLIAVPVLILSFLSFLGQVIEQLIRLLPFVFLSVFGFGGVMAIIDSGYRSGVWGGLELIVGSFTTLIVLLNLFLMISNHKHDTAILRGRTPRKGIRNIVLDKIEKPRFSNPHTEVDLTQAGLTAEISAKETLRSTIKNKVKSLKVKSRHSSSTPISSIPDSSSSSSSYSGSSSSGSSNSFLIQRRQRV